MKSIIVAFILVLPVGLLAQQHLETLPEYPGGQVALMQYIASFTLPPNANLNGFKGKIYASIVIDTLGRVNNVEIVKSSGNEMLDSVFVSHLDKMPSWKPGRLYGKVMPTTYIIPINCLKLTE